MSNTDQEVGDAYTDITADSPTTSEESYDRLTQIARSGLTTAPFEVRLRYEEDVANSYRAWYRDQVVKDHRTELGRFLFGVSFTTVGILLALTKFTTPATGGLKSGLIWLAGSVTVLLSSSLCSLYLAVPRGKQIDPNEVDLVELQWKSGVEIKWMTAAWFFLWLVGLLTGGTWLILY